MPLLLGYARWEILGATLQKSNFFKLWQVLFISQKVKTAGVGQPFLWLMVTAPTPNKKVNGTPLRAGVNPYNF